jgi:antitoxin component YwqK of YwqJK toxin-antitoxin module
LKLLVNFKNDVYEGNFKGWNETGFLFMDYNYKNGYEEGLQRAWFADGRLRMNYVVKDNRKYGLTGIKNCKSEIEK